MKRILTVLTITAVLSGFWFATDAFTGNFADKCEKIQNTEVKGILVKYRKNKANMNRSEKILQKKRNERIEAAEKAKKCAECKDDEECKKVLECE